MAPHSSNLAWRMPWMEEPGGLQSMGSQGHDWVTSLSLFTFMHWRRKWQPTPVFFPGESQGRRSLVGCRLWGRRVGHDWSDLVAAAAAAAAACNLKALDGKVYFTPPHHHTPPHAAIKQHLSLDSVLALRNLKGGSRLVVVFFFSFTMWYTKERNKTSPQGPLYQNRILLLQSAKAGYW